MGRYVETWKCKSGERIFFFFPVHALIHVVKYLAAWRFFSHFISFHFFFQRLHASINASIKSPVSTANWDYTLGCWGGFCGCEKGGGGVFSPGLRIPRFRPWTLIGIGIIRLWFLERRGEGERRESGRGGGGRKGGLFCEIGR